MNFFSLFCRRILGFLLLAALLPLAVRADSWSYPSNIPIGSRHNITYNGDSLPAGNSVKLWALTGGVDESNVNNWTFAGANGGPNPGQPYSATFTDIYFHAGENKFRVTAGNADNVFEYPIAFTTIYTSLPDSTAPTQPGAITPAYVSASSFSASWGASTDASGIKLYHVQLRAGSANGSVINTWTTTGTSWTFTGLGGGAIYGAAVWAEDNNSNLSIERSAEYHLLDTTPPAQPGAPSFSAITSSSFVVTWTGSTDSGGSGLSTYHLVVTTGSPDGPLAVDHIYSPGPSCTVPGLQDSTTYYVSIYAKDGDGNSSTRSTNSATTLDGTPPTTPGIPTFSGISHSSAVATWAPSTDPGNGSGFKEYEVKLHLGSVGGTLLATRTTLDTNWAFTELIGSTNYAVAVRARDHAGNTSPPSVGNFTTLAGGGSPIAWGVVSPLSTPVEPTATSAVGVLGGGLTVDNKGGANYEVPLKLPPARGGLGPKVSLVYNSQGGNGPVGQGWSISTGFPQAITRGREIRARDGGVRGINFADTDKYYLDGKRLIYVGGGTGYGTPNSTYRTEVDSFVTVTATGSSGTIETFEVVDKAGVKMVFGKHAGSSDGYQKPAGSGATLAYAYALKHVQDTMGNTVEFLYQDVTTTTGFRYGEYVLSEIRYSGGGPTALGKVFFHHNFKTLPGSPNTDRLDQSASFISTYAFARSRRLDAIEVTFNGDRVGYYALDYQYARANGHLQLKKIEPFLADAAGVFSRFGATDITWSDVEPGEDRLVTTGPLFSPANKPQPESGFETAYYMRPNVFADFNGDGKTDYVRFGGTSLNVALSNGTGFDPPQSWYGLAVIPSHRTVMTGDFNGDGLPDVLYGTGNFDEIYVLKSTGKPLTGFTGLNGAGPTLALNGTDSARIFRDRVDTTTQHGREREGAGMASRVTIGDFTGDGRDDILLHGFDGYVHLIESTGTGFLAPRQSSVRGMGWEAGILMYGPHWLLMAVTLPPEHHTIQPIVCDLNGDGLKDYVSVVTNRQSDNGFGTPAYGLSRTLEMRVSLPNPSKLPTGDFSPPSAFGFQHGFSSAGIPMDWTKVIYAVMPVDVNNDGLTDFMILGDNYADAEQPLINHRRWTLYLNRGAPNDTGWPTFETILAPIPNTVTAPGGEVFNAFYTPFISTFNPAFDALQVHNTPEFLEHRARLESAGGSGMQFTDMNGDGYADLVWYAATKPNYSVGSMEPVNSGTQGWWVLYSNRGKPDANGSYFSKPQRLTKGTAAYSSSGSTIWEIGGMTPAVNATSNHIFLGKAISNSIDLDGDGRPDWLCYNMSYGENESLDGIALGRGPLGSVVTKVKDGLGRETTIEYLAAKDDRVYTDGAPVSYPIQNLRASNPVVSRVEQDSGAATPAAFTYQYSGNRLDLSGRGSLGFHSFVTLDEQTGLFKYQFLTQSFPMTGLTHREETYRWWRDAGQDKFRFISSHDNTVVFDQVVTTAGAGYGTFWPYISQATEYRWEDHPTTSHFDFPIATAHAQAEKLFPKDRPAGHHIKITAKSWFDGRTTPEPQTRVPGGYYASDYNATNPEATRNVVKGAADLATFNALLAALAPAGDYGKIKHGNLTKLVTDFGEGYTETVETEYEGGVAIPGTSGLTLTGRPKNVTTSVTPLLGGDPAPVKRYTYESGNPALVKTEQIDAVGTELDLTTTYTRGTRGRITSIQISSPHPSIGTYFTFTANDANFDNKWDQPTLSKNAEGYEHSTTTAYHSFLGLPTSVTDVNGAQVTTTYDAMGRTRTMTDVLKGLTTTTTYSSDATVVAAPTAYPSETPPRDQGFASTAAFKAVTVTTEQPTVTTYYDRLGRPIRVEKETFDGGTTYADTIYNLLGQVVATTLPYAAPNGAASGGKQWTFTWHDDLGRPSKVFAPNGTETATTYAGRTTTVSVAAPGKSAQVNQTLVDAKGRTVQVWNPDPVTGAASSTPSLIFTLDGFGRMRETAPAGGGTIKAKYDALGRQTELDDPDKGLWKYTNNALGQVVEQEDANHTITISTFDRLGRPLVRTTTETAGPVETAKWFYYDAAANSTWQLVAKGTDGWVGALQRDEVSTSGVPGYAAEHSAAKTIYYYNDRGLPSRTLAAIDSKLFTTQTAYDQRWRPQTVRYAWKPAGAEDPGNQPYVWQQFGYTYAYNPKGYLLSIIDTESRSWWSNPTYDHLDRVTQVKRGNGHWTKRGYRASDGVLETIRTGPTAGAGAGSGDINDQVFVYDGLGNLVSRTGSGGTETLTYDELNRLKTSKQGTMNYSPNGNIESKPDVSGATVTISAYVSGKPHAVWKYTHGGQQYQVAYDANGNVTSRTGGGQTWDLRYAGFDKPRWMTKTSSTGTVGSEFRYNANRSRILQLEYDAVNASGVPSHYVRKRTYGLGSTLELNYDNTAAAGAAEAWKLKKIRLYVPGPDGMIGSREFDVGPAIGTGSEKALVYHYDHLGSIESITPFGSTAVTLAADSGGKPGRYSEDAWGQRRNPFTWAGKPDVTGGNKSDDGHADSLTPRGFTGHEMLDDLGLVHMNGRIYDPLLGRMLSADILVQAPGNLQAYNRYSYVFNNPLSYTDPSGFKTISDYEKEKEKARSNIRDLISQAKAGKISLTDFVTKAYGQGQIVVNSNDAIRHIGDVAQGLSKIADMKVDARQLDDVDPTFKAAAALTTGMKVVPGLTAGNEASKGNYGAATKEYAKDVALTLIGMRIGKWLSAAGSAEGKVASEVVEEAVEQTAKASANGPAANRAAFEAYKDTLRAEMSRPPASNAELNAILDKLYRTNAQVGSGSTAAAVRQELATGQPVGGAFHSQKAAEMITNLRRWLGNNPGASSMDRAAAENVIKDMQNALGK